MAGFSSHPLFPLLRNALWSTPLPDGFLPLSEGDWRDVYMVSRNQAVQGVVFDSVKALAQGSGPSVSMSAKWLVDVMQIENRFGEISSAIDSLETVWSNLGIEVIRLKGDQVAKMYPVPEHRVCGDIDWYFKSEEDRSKACQWAEEKGLSPQMDSDGVSHFVSDGVISELHLLPFDPSSPVEILVMLNMHILKHSMVMGVGLRQLCDLAMAYRWYDGQYDGRELLETLSSKGLRQWTGLLHTVLTEVIGMPGRYLPFESPAVNHRDVDRYMELLRKDGNFGLAKKRRLSGGLSRASLFLRYCPHQFFSRWFGLLNGRIKRHF